MQNNELKNTVDTILTNLNSDPINDVISTNQIFKKSIFK